MGGSANPNMVQQPMAANPNMPQPTARPHVQGQYQNMMYRPNTQTMGGNNLGPQPMNRTGFSSMAEAQQSLQQPQNPYKQAAAAQTDAMAANRAGMGMVGMGTNVLGSALNRTNQGMNETAAGGMSAYQNPYEYQVVQASMRDIGNQGLKMQNTLGAQAQAAGAFGGSRHGIAEAELATNTQQQMLDQAAKLRAQGFNTALGASQADLGRQLGAAGQSAGIGGQVAGMGSTLAGLGNNLSGLGQTSFNMANTIADRQAAAGSVERQMMDQLIKAGQGQYGQFTQQPQTALNTFLGTLTGTGAPQFQGTSSSFNPGLFNYFQTLAMMPKG